MLKEKDILRGEVLYSEGDGADFLFFMKEGEIILYCDISDEIQIPVIETGQSFNVPICVYRMGSYFGDQECLTEVIKTELIDDKKYYRQATAEAWQNCSVL